jgi:[acyl-carrier-protein] S-malonyltransferase
VARKIAFIFPGQGSQYVGMGQEWAKNFPVAKEVFDRAETRLGVQLTDFCFGGPEQVLKQTINTQPAVLTVTVAILKVLAAEGVRPHYVAGHSLGEYAALVAAEALDFDDAVYLVRKRGQFMEEAVPEGQGVMAAVLGLPDQVVEAICFQSVTSGIVEPANYNCPGQIVIAGEREAVNLALARIREQGGKGIMLEVSGPFHSSLMQPAGEKLAAELDKATWSVARLPLVANVSGEYVSNPNAIRDALVAQVSRPVLWENSMRRLIADGVDLFVEVGPGKVLTGLMRKIDKNVKALNIEDIRSLKKLLALLEEGG